MPGYGGERMRDIIQRMKLERRLALLFTGAILLVAVLLHVFTGSSGTKEVEPDTGRVEQRS